MLLTLNAQSEYPISAISVVVLEMGSGTPLGHTGSLMLVLECSGRKLPPSGNTDTKDRVWRDGEPRLEGKASRGKCRWTMELSTCCDRASHGNGVLTLALEFRSYSRQWMHDLLY